MRSVFSIRTEFPKSVLTLNLLGISENYFLNGIFSQIRDMFKYYNCRYWPTKLIIFEIRTIIEKKYIQNLVIFAFLGACMCRRLVYWRIINSSRPKGTMNWSQCTLTNWPSDHKWQFRKTFSSLDKSRNSFVQSDKILAPKSFLKHSEGQLVLGLV